MQIVQLDTPMTFIVRQEKQMKSTQMVLGTRSDETNATFVEPRVLCIF